MSHREGTKYSASMQVTQDVFDRLVTEESSEPDCRVTGVHVFPSTGGWSASCVYRGVAVSAHGYASRPSFDADANLVAELAASVAANGGAK
jgi:hypothetical protein